MNQLPAKPRLRDYQDIVRQLVEERGFAAETITEVFLVLTEEIGELAKAVRKHTGVKSDKNSADFAVAEEAADVLFMLLDVCNRLDIDLEQAFRAKETKNQSRTWK